MKRIPIIDFIRFASIFVVLGGHLYPQWMALGYPEWVGRIIIGAFWNSPFGVKSFFVVSGFLITQMLAEQQADLSKIDLKSFYVRRAARIFPLLMMVILLSLVLAHYEAGINEKIRGYDTWKIDTGFNGAFWLSLLTFNFNWFVVSKNGAIALQWAVMWSLAIEEQFYLFYPLILKLLKKRQRTIVFLISVVLLSISLKIWAFFHNDFDTHWIKEGSFTGFEAIAIGSLTYFLSNHLKAWLEKNQSIAMGLTILGIGISLFFYVASPSVHVDSMVIIVLPTLFALGCGMAILGGLYWSFLHSTAAHWLSWPGKLSYGCYLWHPTILRLLFPVLAFLGGLPALFYLMVTVWIFAFISYNLFEIPANKRIRLFFDISPSKSL